MKLISPIKSV